LKRPPNQPVFKVSRSQFWRLVQKYAKAAGVPSHKAHPHALKHSIAMQSIHSAGIENVRQYLGHKSISSTGAYLRVNDADASSAVRAAVADWMFWFNARFQNKPWFFNGLESVIICIQISCWFEATYGIWFLAEIKGGQLENRGLEGKR
jgi:Phage integrase family